MANVIELDGLSKSYGVVHAVRGVTLSVPQGVVFGMLGPNGAGKSTLLRMMLGLVQPSAGRVQVLGRAPQTRGALRDVGALIEAPALYPFLSGRGYLEALARTSAFKDNARIEAILRLVGLTDAAQRKARTYSLGMKQRLGIAGALLTRPHLLILDEPTNGMDPAGIQEVRELLRMLVRDEGISVLICSHLLDEAQKVCDRVAILDKGSIVVEGAVRDLVGAERLYIEADPIERVIEIAGATPSGAGAIATVSRDAAPDLLRKLHEAGVRVYEARRESSSLEDVFFRHTSARQ